MLRAFCKLTFMYWPPWYVVGGYIIIYYAHGMFHSDGLHSNSANKLIGEDLLLLFLKGKQIRVLRLVRFTLGMLLHAIVSVAFLNRDGQFPVSVLLQSTVILQQPATSPIQSLGKALLTKPSSNCKARETKEEFVSLSKVWPDLAQNLAWPMKRFP